MDVNASGAQGVQVGDGNVQHNEYYIWLEEKRHRASSLAEPGSHEAAEPIKAISYDETLLLTLLKADVAVAAATLDGLLKTDETLAVSLLADISWRRAKALIAVVMPDVPGREWLGNLAEAAEAIGNRAAELKWTDPGPLEHIPGTSPELGDDGYSQTYKNGQVYWGRRPATAPRAAAVTGVILDHYLRSGGANGSFGLPLDEKMPVEAAAGGRWVQHFRGGAIYHDDSGVIEVRQSVSLYLLSRVDGHQRYPLGPETDAPVSPYGTRGRMQQFQGAWDAHDETVYHSTVTDACGVRGSIESFYHQLGGTSSWLGFPTTRQRYLDGHLTQDFEGGTVFAWPDRPVAVPTASMELIRRDENTMKRLGFPATAEEPTGTGDDSWQFFQNGVVTVKDGKRQVWVRPAWDVAGGQAGSTS